MNNHQQMVLDFHTKMNQAHPDSPVFPDYNTLLLRRKLVGEEAIEFIQEQDDLVNYAKELADILYVTYGSAVAAGIDIEPIFAVVHESNMQKMSGSVSSEGKRLKPVDWQNPRDAIQAELLRQGAMQHGHE